MPGSRFAALPGAAAVRAADILNREDYHLNTDAFHNTLRDSFKANLDYTRDSTLDSELDETGNVIQDRATRERLALGPSWTRTLTELTRLELAYQYSNVEYSDDPGANLVDYKYHVDFCLTATPADPAHAGHAGSAATAAIDRIPTLIPTPCRCRPACREISVKHWWPHSWSVSAKRHQTPSSAPFVLAPIGPLYQRYSSRPAGEYASRTTSAVYSASITKTLETGSLGASLSRSSSPGGNGELLDATRLALTGDYKLSETFSTSLRIEYTENETIVSRGGAVAPNQDKETFFRVTPRASWRWRREWELAGEYQYAENDDPTAGKATRNAVYATLTYRPVKISVSR